MTRKISPAGGDLIAPFEQGPSGTPALPDIEVTPEMIEAGLPHLYRYHPDRGVDAEETVVAILQACLSVRAS